MREESAFIRGPCLSTVGQSFTPYDFHQRNAWCDGLNKMNWEAPVLQDFVDKQVSSEIDHYQLRVTAPRDACGRGLVAGKSYKEGDRVMDLSCLFFDEVSVDALEHIFCELRPSCMRAASADPRLSSGRKLRELV